MSDFINATLNQKAIVYLRLIPTSKGNQYLIDYILEVLKEKEVKENE